MIGPILGGIQRAKFDAASYALTVSGNSISDAAVSDLWTQVRALAPISGQLTIHNCAINGKSIQYLAANPGPVDAAYENGKINYLPIFELTNNIHNDGRTGAQTIADLIAYIAARQAYVASNRPGQKPWRVILATGLPRGDFLTAFTAAQGEIEMQYCNAYIRQHYREMGAVAYIEMRRSATGVPGQVANPVPGYPFDFTDVTNAANFPAALWTDKTHPSNSQNWPSPPPATGATGGKSILAQYWADVLKRLPAR